MTALIWFICSRFENYCLHTQQSFRRCSSDNRSCYIIPLNKMKICVTSLNKTDFCATPTNWTWVQIVFRSWVNGSLNCYLEEFLRLLFVSFLPCCQKQMLIITNAIPIGRKTPILSLTIHSKMEINSLIEKSVAAVLYDFEFLDGLLLMWKFLSSTTRYIKFVPCSFGSQYYHFIMNSPLWRHFCIVPH